MQEIRKKKKITQEKLAELSNLSINYISKIERTDGQNISIKSLFAISEALEINPSELLSLENPKKI
ncbi:helix-turn-helix domain-containing protein [Companilactobacillus sp. DQM5]|uniref:helix-turn-helix domain-containing protein n=1 Tax=Companilactobacillus sp. DQM5 TaxID=3463359 RepID=UPI00405941D8